MKCSRETCEYQRHSDLNNNGGTHCCLTCKNNNKHGLYCKKLLLTYTHRNSLHTRITNPFTSGGTHSWFTPIDISKIYNFNSPSSEKVSIGVISFGGGLYGNLDSNGILTNGDVQAYWKTIGIPVANHPTVVIQTIGGAVNTPDINDSGYTFENTIDVETVGGCYPSKNLTIILYIAPNNLSYLGKLIDKAINDNVYKPSILSISWGSPEINYTSSLLTSINTVLKTASEKGITICVATGDNGSSDNTVYKSCADFPASSPYCTAVGGTTLVCPQLTYNSNTVETAWSNGGGAVSRFFVTPSYQTGKIGSRIKRSIPDIASNADPNTGLLYYIGGKDHGNYYIFGGTSIAAPTIAAYFGLCNKKIFINPKLYLATANSFHDIKSGSNGQYNATSGYDNCTGLGSINGKLLYSKL